MSTRALALSLLTLAALTRQASAQPSAATPPESVVTQVTGCDSYDRDINAVASATSDDAARAPALRLVDVGQSGRCFAEFAPAI